MLNQTSVLGAKKTLAPIVGAPGLMGTLVNELLPRFHDASVMLERARQHAVRVDGKIIGTGEADFTKGNTLYTLNFKGKTFQLMDVPGIEGNESQYADLVRQAVAKAHLVFYVNGTNKKPEAITAQKIKSYLRRGTQVYSILNVRANADAYEFDEDRVSLRQSHVDEALNQTMGVLENSLSREVMLGGSCVQGLLAFSSLAFDVNGKHTSIHPSRDRDLVLQQRNCLKYFGAPEVMQDFSQIDQVASVLKSKLGTFKEDIIESNKTKVMELLAENITVLSNALADHEIFLAKLEPEFKKNRDSLEQALCSFERKTQARRRSLCSEFFNKFSSKGSAAVENHFGDNDRIDEAIKYHFKNEQASLRTDMESMLRECLEELQAELQESLKRLQQDVQRVDFQSRPALADVGNRLGFQAPDLQMGLGLKGWGQVIFQIGSYAASGAAIGSVFPVVGNVIGGVVGAVVGALMTVVGWFTSKEKRIRKAQNQLQSKIDDMRSDVMKRLAEGDSELSEMVRAEIGSGAFAQVESLASALRKPLPVIKSQIVSMTQIQQQLKEMPHGAIQAI
ncbi:hypothetical protein [Leptothrix ochracea]|uniref:hypothetical protein n=1 Tax=Leptothrix ochracea TaxID=735331 RepID=UPI0034E23593